MPKVSVIIPVYCVEKYIERCVVSLFEQSLDDIEYLFIDDCSPDNSISIVKKVLERYPLRQSQVVFHQMEQNSGQAKVREWGIKNATGDFVIHCDSDDWVDTGLYQMLYNTAIREKADIVGCDYRIVSNKGEILKRYPGFSSVNKEELISNLLLLKDSWSLWNKLIKSELYESISFFPQYNMGEDMLLVLQMVIKAKKIAYVPDIFYNYFHNLNSITYSDTYERVVSRYKQCQGNTELVCRFFKENNLLEKYKEEIIYLRFYNRSLIKPALCNFSNWKVYVCSSRKSNCDILKSKFISNKDKYTHLFILIGLYSIVLWSYKTIKGSREKC